jgi:hypothetical protein
MAIARGIRKAVDAVIASLKKQSRRSMLPQG